MSCLKNIEILSLLLGDYLAASVQALMACLKVICILALVLEGILQDTNGFSPQTLHELSEAAVQETGPCSASENSCSLKSLIMAVLISEQEGLSEQLTATARNVSCWADALLLISRTSTDSAATLLGTAPMKCNDDGAPKRKATLFATAQHGLVFNSMAHARNAALAFAAKNHFQWAMIMKEGESLGLQKGPESLRAQLQDSRADVLHCFRADEIPVTQPCFIRLPAVGTFVGPVDTVYVAPNRQLCASAENISASSSTDAETLTQSPTAAEDRAHGPGCSSIIKQASVLPSTPVKEVLDNRVAVLTEYLQETGRHQAHWWYSLALTLAMLDDHVQAASLYKVAAVKASSDTAAHWFHYKAIMSYGAARDVEEARATAKAAMQECWSQKPQSCAPELLWSAALQAYGAGNYTDAVQYGEVAAAAGCSIVTRDNKEHTACAMGNNHLYFDAPAWYELPWDVLLYAYNKLGNNAAAKAASESFTAAKAARLSADFSSLPVMGVYHVQTLDELGVATPQDKLQKDEWAGQNYTTIVTGFFTASDNHHRPKDTYYSYVQEFLPLIKAPMVIFTSKEDYPLLKELRGDLPAIFKVFDSVWALEPAMEFRSVIERQFVDHPEWTEGKGCISPVCSAVWNSKPWMVAQAAAENPYNSSYFVWVDIGSFRWGRHSLRNWPDKEKVQELEQHSTRVAVELVAWPTPMTIFGESFPHFVAGTWFGGTSAAVNWFSEAFSDMFRRRHALGLYVFEDQVMMGSLLLSQPDKFVILQDLRAWLDGPGGGWKRLYESTPGAAKCSVSWYMQFQVQLASDEERLLHLNTIGCQVQPYKTLAPFVTEYALQPASEVPN